MQTSLWTILLVLNLLWFGAASRYFGLTPRTAANLLVPRQDRNAPMFFTLAGSIRFLGGLNFAFAVLALALLLLPRLFPQPQQIAFFAAVFAVAHASQFAGNLPMLGAHRRGQAGAWSVLEGPMLFIFATDSTLMVANGIFALLLLLSF